MENVNLGGSIACAVGNSAGADAGYNCAGADNTCGDCGDGGSSTRVAAASGESKTCLAEDSLYFSTRTYDTQWLT